MYVYDETNNRWIPLRHTVEYIKKKKLVRDAWIVVGIVMGGLPLPFAVVLALLTTFLSFMFLDESSYSDAFRG
ncbi:MAG: hypothetical protein L0Z73_03040 [Gammaproteobacteria bacterium]|nr:hypothetical protein [Gammaproteobacteria bacterium]